jgi:hypothetical protein
MWRAHRIDSHATNSLNARALPAERQGTGDENRHDPFAARYPAFELDRAIEPQMKAHGNPRGVRAGLAVAGAGIVISGSDASSAGTSKRALSGRTVPGQALSGWALSGGQPEDAWGMRRSIED